MTAYFSSSPTARSLKFLFLASALSGAVLAAFCMVQPLRHWVAGRRSESALPGHCTSRCTSPPDDRPLRAERRVMQLCQSLSRLDNWLYRIRACYSRSDWRPFRATLLSSDECMLPAVKPI